MAHTKKKNLKKHDRRLHKKGMEVASLPDMFTEKTIATIMEKAGISHNKAVRCVNAANRGKTL